MFERLEDQRPGNPKPEIFLAGGEPVEFTHNGQRFRIHTILSSWHESGGWWNRAEREEGIGLWRIRPTSRPA